MGRRLTRGKGSRKPPSVARDPAPVEAEAGRRAAAIAIAVLAALAGLWVFRGALAYGFAQDDFHGLARATGLAPRLAEPWRFLSAQLTFDVLWRMLGERGNGWHALPLAAHALNAAGIALLLARRVRPAAALVGAAFFATHGALFHALYWFSAHSDVFATLFAMATLVLALREGRARWLAVPAFVAALLEKESVLLLPAVLAAWRLTSGDRARNGRVSVLAALGAVAIAYAAYFALAVYPKHFAASGTAGAPGPDAYGSDPSRWGAALLTYSGWSANAFFLTVRSFSDALDPSVTAWGAGTLALVGAGLFVPALATRGGREGALVFIVMLLPVLPLTEHTYHYYLYAALPGLAALAAALADLALGRAGNRAGWTAAIAVAALLAWNGSALVRRIENQPFPQPGLRSDSIVDRARIAANLIEDLRAANLPAGTSLYLWSPQIRAMERSRGGDPTRESYFESNVRAAVIDGLGVRASLRGLGPVEFRRDFTPAGPAEYWGVYRYDGHVRVLQADSLARILANPPR